MTQKQIFQLPIGAGQYTEQSERGAVGRWYSMDKVRFRKGLAEKIGGWVRLEPQFAGICRRLKDWSSLDGKYWAAVATDVKLYLWQDGQLFDITPLRREVTLTAPFTTEDSPSLNVTVEDINHGAQKGDYVTFSGGIVGGSSGILVDGEYIITSVVDQDSYTISVASAATGPGAANEGGTPLAQYDISAGAESVVTATGYGTGPYGREGYGNARTGSTIRLDIRTWSLDTWGEDLLANPRNGAIYWWDRSLGTGARATALAGEAPPQNEYMIVSQRDRHIIALGAYDYFNEAYDPLLIRWSSTEDLNDWIPTSTNTAGDLRLYSGSKIVTGVRSRLETVIFTDVSVHTLPFVGGFDVFGLNIVGENVSILGPNAAVPIDHRVIFMAESDFYIYDGIVKAINCDVRNLVYDNLNTVQRDKVYGALNREFNEVWFFYPSYDINAWVQTNFSVGQTPGYETADFSTSTAEVYFQANFNEVNGTVDHVEQALGANVELRFGASIQNNKAAELDPPGLVRCIMGAAGQPVGLAAAHELGFDNFCLESKIFWPSTFPIASDVGGYNLLYYFDSSGGAGILWEFALVYDDDLNGGTYTLKLSLKLRREGSLPQDGNWSKSFVIADSGNDPYDAEYHFVAERIGNVVYVGWNGNVVGNLNLEGDGFNLWANGWQPGDTVRVQAASGFDNGKFIGWGYGQSPRDRTYDETRLTKTGIQYGLDSGSTYTIPGDHSPPVAGGAGNPGYTYAFNSSGHTEVIATADNNYEHDYFLSNDEPILEPLESEYAVELDVNPLYLPSVSSNWGSDPTTDYSYVGKTHTDTAVETTGICRDFANGLASGGFDVSDDGLQCIVACAVVDDAVRSYTLDAPYDFSNATSTGSANSIVSTQLYTMQWVNSGLSYIVSVGNGGTGDLRQYTSASAYVINGTVAATSTVTNANLGFFTDLAAKFWMSRDGTRLCGSGNTFPITGDFFRMFTLSTPYDITSYVFASEIRYEIVANAPTNDVEDFEISEDGLTLICFQSGQRYQAAMSVAFDLTTLVWATNNDDMETDTNSNAIEVMKISTDGNTIWAGCTTASTPFIAEYTKVIPNPSSLAQSRGGLCFLRTNLTGNPNTDADDAQQLMFTIDYANNQAAFYKKTAAGVAAPTNLGTNTVNFTTLTGSAVTQDQKYILSVQFDTPTITAWVDGIQAFQFALDATELTQFTSGSMGLHQTPGTDNELFRFYNLAAGPLGTITDPDFDISPIEVNRYVAFNYEEGSWITGKMRRTAWADRSPLIEKPYAAGADGYLYQHETGADNNGAAMSAFIESFDMEIPSAGEDLMHVDQLIPDFLTLEGSVQVSLTGRKYPQDPNRISKGPYTVENGTRKVSTRIRARQIAIRIESSDTGDIWRMGNWRGRAGAHGKRG